MFLSLLIAAAIVIGAYAYAGITRDLPSVQTLPHLLNPPDGLLLQPSRIYDRSGQHLLFTFSASGSSQARRYISINSQNPQHIPAMAAEAMVSVADPGFWSHNGFSMLGIDAPESHPTIAQKLVNVLVTYNEPPSMRRALRERLIAAQITAQFGREQILEWYLNSADFGNFAFGIEEASQFYFGKTAGQLTLAEAAILAAASDTPTLNPLDAPELSLRRGRELIQRMDLPQQEMIAALAEIPQFMDSTRSSPQAAPAFINLVMSQLDSQIPRERLERGGMNIFTTLDFALQEQAACAVEVYALRLAAADESSAECDAARFLPSLPPGTALADSSASALILDPKSGQVLALVGETRLGAETPLVSAHQPGSSLDAFVYLTAFTRGLSPATLTWDVPSEGIFPNFDGTYHGPMRLRVALANDYQVPLQTLKQQMGADNIASIESSFDLEMNADVSMLQLAGAYGVFGTQGVYFGQLIGGEFQPVTVLKVESTEHELLLDWVLPQAKPVLTPGLAYLMTHVLSDSSTRARSLLLDAGRPAGIKVGQTADGRDAWTVGYTPKHVVVTWTGLRGNADGFVTPHHPSALWTGLMQIASADSPQDGWSAPQGVSTMTVCDPSGMLPTRECPNLVNEVFLNGSEPVQADTLFRAFDINRETGLLATVFTPPELIEKRVYMIVPDHARAWAEGEGLGVPPSAYDAIQPPSSNPFVNIESPELFADVSGQVRILGTAAGEDFSYYRIQVGKGLNPAEWVQVGSNYDNPIENGLLAEWETSGLEGLYAVQLQVIRTDQRVETAVIQVTIK